MMVMARKKKKQYHANDSFFYIAARKSNCDRDNFLSLEYKETHAFLKAVEKPWLK